MLEYEKYKKRRIEIENLLRVDDTRGAILAISQWVEEIRPLIESDIYKNHVISLSARRYRITNFLGQGMISIEEFGQKKDSINHACLNILDQIETAIRSRLGISYPGIHGLPPIIRIDIEFGNLEQLIIGNQNS